MTRAATPLTPTMTRYPLVFDGLNCAAFDAAQMTTTRRGRVSAMNMTVIRPSARLADALLDVDRAWRTAATLRDSVAIVTSVAGLEAAQKSERIGIVLGAQNSLMFEDDLALVGVFKRLGLRIIQPTYNEKTVFGFGAAAIGARDKGMSDRGRDWLTVMHAERLLIDLSHCGHRTTREFAAAATAPVVCSHANAFAICPSPRNKTDDVLKAIAATGGLTGVVMWSPAVAHAHRPTLDDWLDHVMHMIRVSGAEHVGFASDVSERIPETKADWDANWGRNGIYPGIVGPCGDWYEFETRHNVHYSSLAHTPRLWDGLRRRGVSTRDLEMIMGGNWRRVLRDVWGE